MRPLPLLAVLAGPLAIVAAAQSPSPAQFVATDDVQFAENLARYRYFDLAFDVLDEVRTRKLDTDTTGTLEFTEARILRRASESTNDAARQLEYLTKAIDKLSEWARTGSPYVYHPRRIDALEDLSSALQARGQLRAGMLKTAPADQQESLRADADSDFGQADAVLVTLEREDSSQAEAATAAGKTDAAARLSDKAALTLFARGLNSLQWSEVDKDRVQRLEEAKQALIDYQWALEEERIGQYFALHYQGVVLHRLGENAEALELQHDVLAKGQYWWDNYLGGGDPSASATIAELFDRTWGEIAALQADGGDIDAADATIDTMLAQHAKAKLAFGRPGWQVLLDWAEREDQLGRRAKASALVKQVADGAASLPEGERARDMLASMLTSGSSSTEQASASVLLAAAKGLYDRREYGEAGFAYERAAAALTSPAEKKEFELPAWLGAARSLAGQKRYLEAALACERALDAAVAAGADKDSQAALAIEMYGNFDQRARETSDPFDKALKAQAIERVTRLGVGLDLPYYEAKEHFENALAASPQDPRLYEAALAELAKVAPEASNYERALVLMARCQQGAGRTAEALRAYDAILQRAADPAQAPQNPQARSRREIALGEAIFNKADLLLSEAVARPADALALLEHIEDKVPGQPGFVESGKYQRAVAYTQLGKLEEAAAAIDDLKAFRPESPTLRSAYFKLSAALLAASEKADKAGDGAGALALLLRAADALWASAELAGFPSFNNVVSTGDWYSRAGRVDLAGRSYQKALDVFDKPGSGVSASQLDQARLGLANALTSQRDFARARPLWQALLERSAQSAATMAGAARCYGGWLEQAADGSITEVEGSGDYDDAFKLWSDIVARLPGSSRYKPEWWEGRLGQTYTKYRLGLLRPSSMPEANTILKSIKATFPDYDTPQGVSGAPATTYAPLFRYLEQKIPDS